MDVGVASDRWYVCFSLDWEWQGAVSQGDV